MFALIGDSICWVVVESDTQLTIFDLSALKKQLLIFFIRFKKATSYLLKQDKDDVIHVEPEGEQETFNVIDLMEILKQRFKESDDKKTKQKASGTGTNNSDLNSKSKNALYHKAKNLHIEGRSKMSKKELIESIQQTS